MSSSLPRLSYLGIYPPTIARNAVALKGLRAEGITVQEFVTDGKGIKKYLSLIRLVRQHQATTDLWLVGYLSGVLVPLVRLLGRKPIVYNAGHSFYESVVLDRAQVSTRSWTAFKLWLLDWLSFICADLVLVESAAQKRFLSQEFHLDVQKFQVVFTGADHTVFFADPTVPKHTTFSVGFRGGFLPATGVECIIDAMELLKEEPIEFYLYGHGLLLPEIKKRIAQKRLEHVHLDERFLDQDTLRRELLACHVLLGQFSPHPRLERTIQNKTFEALALQMPYITLHTTSNDELLKTGESALFIEKPDPRLLVEAIKRLQAQPEARRALIKGAARTYEEKASSKAIGQMLRQIVCSFLATAARERESLQRQSPR